MKYDEAFLNILLSQKDENENKLYQKSDIFDFKSLPKSDPLLIYTSFIYNQLYNKDERLRINKENFELFLLRNNDGNAFAAFDDKHYIIGIHLPLLEQMEKGVRDCVLNLPSSSTSVFSKNNSVPNVESLTFRFISFFIFFHEYAHLIQHQNSDKAYHLKKFENYRDNYKTSYSEPSHLMEIDADLFAAQWLSIFILENWISFPASLKEIIPIQIILALGSASIFLLFFELNNRGWPSMYFFDYKHPHPTIRMTYIIDLIVRFTIERLPQEASHEFLMNQSLETARQLLNSENKDAFRGYQEHCSKGKNEIHEYINKLGAARKNYPFLIKNLKFD